MKRFSFPRARSRVKYAGGERACLEVENLLSDYKHVERDEKELEKEEDESEKDESGKYQSLEVVGKKPSPIGRKKKNKPAKRSR